MELADTLSMLCSLNGPAGFESPVAVRVKELLTPYMDEVGIDVMGNVIAVKRSGTQNAPKVLLDAHMDEIGLIITGVEEGFLRFSALGGLDARIMPAAEVEILSDPPHIGIICALPPHVLKAEDKNKQIKFEDMYIDVGMSQEQAAKAIPLGTPGVMSCSPRRCGADLICAKALDDRAGVAAILKAVELLAETKPEADLYVMASAQEEVGIRGAGPGAFGISPDYCIVVDVDFAKTPDTKPHEASSALGGGVIISRGPNMNPELTDSITALAKEKGISSQITVTPGGNSGTNARAIQISREGVATAVLGIPLKYMHTSAEIASLRDIESAAMLICETVKSLKGGTAG